MKIIDPGHIYEFEQLGGGTQTVTFVKRSGGAIQYEKEWAGLQTQEVLRALIDRTKYLYKVLPCAETEEALYHLRLSLYWYEVRALRRKRNKVNRTTENHDDSDIPKVRGEFPKDIPFGIEDIELRPIGEDGHIIASIIS